MDNMTGIIIGAAIKVHKVLGPGLLESAYKECLCYELKRLEFSVQKEHPLPLIYEEIHLNHGFRADMIINKYIVIEVKSVEFVTDLHIAQVLTYLKLANCQIGLLINFNVLKLTNGVKRIFNKHAVT